MKHRTKTPWLLRVEPAKAFIDPRLPIARHTGWVRPTGTVTEYATPEPDNYNRAIFAPEPVDCAFVENQVIYYDEKRQGWFTVLLVEPEQMAEYEAWAAKQNWYARWQHDEVAAVRSRVPV